MAGVIVDLEPPRIWNPLGPNPLVNMDSLSRSWTSFSKAIISLRNGMFLEQGHQYCGTFLERGI